MKLRSLEKAAKLPQNPATWQATVRPAPAWIAPKDKPKYRPHLVFVLDAESGAIRMLMLEEQRPAPEAVLSLIANAIVEAHDGRWRPLSSGAHHDRRPGVGPGTCAAIS